MDMQIPPASSIHPISAPDIIGKVLGLLAGEGILPGARWLDVPAGEGALASEVFARRLPVDMRCGDIDPAQYKFSAVPCDLVDLNRSWPYADGSVDVLTCIEGIEHVENPFHVMREAHRVLRAGGHLVLTTPNVLSLRSRWQYLLYGAPNTFDYMAGSPWHINPVSYIELRHIMERTGFVIRHVETNAMTKAQSWWHRLLKHLVRTRGRSWVRGNPKAEAVRKVLLSETVLFGDCLILHAVKM